MPTTNLKVTTQWHKSDDDIVKAVQGDESKNHKVLLLNPLKNINIWKVQRHLPMVGRGRKSSDIFVCDWWCRKTTREVEGNAKFEFIDVYTSICKDTVDGTDVQSEWNSKGKWQVQVVMSIQYTNLYSSRLQTINAQSLLSDDYEVCIVDIHR